MRPFLKILRRVVVALASIVTLSLFVSPAVAAGPPGEIGALVSWLAARDSGKCTERCFTLERITLGGSPAGTLTFVAEGSVLADHPVEVPLFGPPGSVRLSDVREGGKPAPVGFDATHYWVSTASKRFKIEGSFTLTKDLSLVVPGPVSVLDSSLQGGRVVEGAHLAGLLSTTVHFDSGAGKAKEEPTIFQLSRALRVQRETTFEYRLVVRSGTDLGVVRLPLPYGEKVLEVEGATGWKVEGSELVLPTTGKAAQVKVSGTLASVAQTFSPDARGTYEWWLLESDAEHRLDVSGEAKQMDAVESPIARTLPSARLFLLRAGQKLTLGVQSLASVEALAAVLRHHGRLVVLTERGELLGQDDLSYENNGIDYLPLRFAGRPLFLSTDGGAERLLRDDGALMVPLRKGGHVARVQTLDHAAMGLFFGRLPVTMPDQPLAESRVEVSIGLPRKIVPLLVLGGDRVQWFVDPSRPGEAGDRELLLAAAVSVVAAALLLSRLRERVLGGLVLFGGWFVSAAAFWAAVAAIVAVVVGRALWPRLQAWATPRRLALVAGVAVGGAALVMMAVVPKSSSIGTQSAPATDLPNVPAGAAASAPAAADPNLQQNEHKNDSKYAATKAEESKLKTKAGEKEQGGGAETLATTVDGKSGGDSLGWLARVGEGSLEGVAPVALPMPGYARIVTVSRDLVTRDRPFRPVVVYVTEVFLLALLGGWLLLAAVFAWTQRAHVASLRARLRSWVEGSPSGTGATDATPGTSPAE